MEEKKKRKKRERKLMKVKRNLTTKLKVHKLNIQNNQNRLF